jgi:hypothetical protein
MMLGTTNIKVTEITAVCSEIHTKHKCTVWMSECESNYCRTGASRWHILTDTTTTLSLYTINQTHSAACPHIAIRRFIRVSEQPRNCGVTFRHPNRKNYHQDRSRGSHFLHVTSGPYYRTRERKWRHLARIVDVASRPTLPRMGLWPFSSRLTTYCSYFFSAH